jgi:hypothetical protein
MGQITDAFVLAIIVRNVNVATPVTEVILFGFGGRIRPERLTQINVDFASSTEWVLVPYQTNFNSQLLFEFGLFLVSYSSTLECLTEHNRSTAMVEE